MEVEVVGGMIFMGLLWYFAFRPWGKSKKPGGRKDVSPSTVQDTPIEKLVADLKREGLMAAKGMSEQERDKVYQWAEPVIQQYGSTMTRYSELVNDVRVLPYPKEDIKLAIRFGLTSSVANEDQHGIELLKGGYMKLGSFQEIAPADLGNLNARTPGSLQGQLKDMPRAVEDVTAEDMQRMKDIGRLFMDSSATFTKYMTKVQEETQALLLEINRYVTGLESVQSRWRNTHTR